MEWKDILKEEDPFGGMEFDEYVNRRISERDKKEAEKTPLQKLYYVMGGYLDARLADELREVLESERFNDKFQKNLLENDNNNFIQGIFIGYMYSRWRKIRGLNNDDSVENKEKMQS